ncbi:hypothetical protein CMQ_6747 [Grosmannia clavigera kw1407]|uniref:Uncharacterized protein n=1 Tax=Grosmannia clavigera (strain kw1407 / UAMH 11150) TaxID=655863 RepID=F0X7M7_GROCL|nr:uncharacterized protein CMQ_6747 [Grosmannia clavigera kw1407]EFX06426.1 hypothetical protein CMQ_6747 [Grosmannia clavigera kw1407]
MCNGEPSEKQACHDGPRNAFFDITADLSRRTGDKVIGCAVSGNGQGVNQLFARSLTQHSIGGHDGIAKPGLSMCNASARYSDSNTDLYTDDDGREEVLDRGVTSESCFTCCFGEPSSPGRLDIVGYLFLDSLMTEVNVLSHVVAFDLQDEH